MKESASQFYILSFLVPVSSITNNQDDPIIPLKTKIYCVAPPGKNCQWSYYWAPCPIASNLYKNPTCQRSLLQIHSKEHVSFCTYTMAVIFSRSSIFCPECINTPLGLSMHQNMAHLDHFKYCKHWTIIEQGIALHQH